MGKGFGTWYDSKGIESSYKGELLMAAACWRRRGGRLHRTGQRLHAGLRRRRGGPGTGRRKGCTYVCTVCMYVLLQPYDYYYALYSTYVCTDSRGTAVLVATVAFHISAAPRWLHPHVLCGGSAPLNDAGSSFLIAQRQKQKPVK